MYDGPNMENMSQQCTGWDAEGRGLENSPLDKHPMHDEAFCQ